MMSRYWGNTKNVKSKHYFIIPKKEEMGDSLTFNVLIVFFNMFDKYITKQCLKTLARGNHEIFKNWNKRGNYQTQNNGRNRILLMYVKAYQNLKKNPSGYTSHCWRKNTVTNVADAGVLFINLKWYAQFVSYLMVG